MWVGQRETACITEKMAHHANFQLLYLQINSTVYNYFIPFFATVKTHDRPRGAVNDPKHCYPRLNAEGNSALGYLQHRGDGSFDCCTERYEICVLLLN